MTDKPPVFPCPVCGRIISVTDDACWSCGTVYPGRTLWDKYEESRWG